jgi:hypothetical protein
MVHSRSIWASTVPPDRIGRALKISASFPCTRGPDCNSRRPWPRAPRLNLRSCAEYLIMGDLSTSPQSLPAQVRDTGPFPTVPSNTNYELCRMPADDRTRPQFRAAGSTSLSGCQIDCQPSAAGVTGRRPFLVPGQPYVVRRLACWSPTHRRAGRASGAPLQPFGQFCEVWRRRLPAAEISH